MKTTIMIGGRNSGKTTLLQKMAAMADGSVTVITGNRVPAGREVVRMAEEGYLSVSHVSLPLRGRRLCHHYFIDEYLMMEPGNLSNMLSQIRAMETAERQVELTMTRSIHMPDELTAILIARMLAKSGVSAGMYRSHIRGEKPMEFGILTGMWALVDERLHEPVLCELQDLAHFGDVQFTSVGSGFHASAGSYNHAGYRYPGTNGYGGAEYKFI